MAHQVMSDEELHQWLVSSGAFSRPNPDARFDKSAILQRHNSTRSAMSVLTSTGFTTALNVSHPDEPIHPRGQPSALARYKSILLADLRFDHVHHGRVLYGTFVAHPFRIQSLMTVVEDESGSACVVTIPAEGVSDSDFPMGSKVAILEPYFKHAMDGSAAIRIDSKDRLVRIDEISELIALRLEGNSCFAAKSWGQAIEAYTRCIAACSRLLQDSETKGKKRGEVEAGLLAAVANRAEARLRAGENEAALEDCNAALAMEGEHVKSLYRKGRALLAMGEAAMAVECLSKAVELDPGNQEEIGEALERARAAAGN